MYFNSTVQWIQLINSPNNRKHHSFNAGHAQMLGRLVVLVITVLQHVLHDKDDMFDELSVRFVNNHLACRVEKLLDECLDLIE